MTACTIQSCAELRGQFSFLRSRWPSRIVAPAGQEITDEADYRVDRSAGQMQGGCERAQGSGTIALVGEHLEALRAQIGQHIVGVT